MRPGNCGSLEQGLQVVLEIAVVGKARLRLEVEPDLDVLVLELQRLGKTRQRPQAALAKLTCLLHGRQSQQRLAQLGGQYRRQGSPFRRFDAQGVQPGCLGILAHAV